MNDKLILVTGGSGFIGRALITRLTQEGYRVRVPSRNAARVRGLNANPAIEAVEADIQDRATLDELLAGASAVINLVGVLHSRSGTPWGPDFDQAHVALPGRLVAACQKAGVHRLVHISALGANADGPSQYQRSKAAGEEAVRNSEMAWTIVRPSVVFGPGDSFLNLFAQLTKYFPALPLAGANTRFQPVFVEDVAEVIVRSLSDDSTVGQTFELAGPRVYTLAELVRYVGTLTGRKRLVFGLPEPLAMLQAASMEVLPRPPMSRDNVRSLRVDNIASGPPLPFDLNPTSLEEVGPGYLNQKADH